MDLITWLIDLCILDCFFTNFNTDDPGVRKLLHDAYSNCADSTSQVKNDLTLFYGVNYFLVQDFTHVHIDLQECRRRYLVGMVEDLLLVERGAIKKLRFLGRNAVCFPIV